MRKVVNAMTGTIRSIHLHLPSWDRQEAKIAFLDCGRGKEVKLVTQDRDIIERAVAAYLESKTLRVTVVQPRADSTSLVIAKMEEVQQTCA